MTKAQATAEIFWMAFQALPPKEKNAVLQRIAQDKQLRKDLADLGIVKPRSSARPRSVRKRMTAQDLLNSSLIGMWQDRTDIDDSAAYARQLREQAQRRDLSQ
jgi:hypothetical protein